MQKEYDIYLSYSSQDNAPKESEKGWITSFHQFLELILGQILNSKTKFLFVSNQEKPSAELISKSRVVICILSPAYVSSEYCLEDVEIFNKSNHLEAKNIFKVIKSPVSNDQEPGFLQDKQSYELFNVDTDSGAVSEIHDFFSIQARGSFWMRLMDLAYDVAETLITEDKTSFSINNQGSVYLAHTGFDLIQEREYIKRELQKHGFQVLPLFKFPTNIREVEAEVLQNLKKCHFSIHLIGKVYGDSLPGSEMSMMDLENKMAAEYALSVAAENEFKGSNQKFGRIIWISPEAEEKEPRQKVFAESFLKDAEELEGAEVMHTPIEDLKFILRKELIAPVNKSKTSLLSKKKNKLYLLFDKVDQGQTGEMIEYLKSHGYEILTPNFNGELMDLRNRHIENLKNCDAAIIHFGKVNEQWVRMKLFDILKAPGFGRTKPIHLKGIYACGAPLDDNFYSRYGVEIVQNGTGFSPESFQPFLDKLDKIVYG